MQLVWWDRTHLITAKDQLEKLKGLVLRCIMEAAASTPTAAVDVAVVGIEPLHLTVAAAAVKEILRVGNLEGSNGIMPEVLKIGRILAMPLDRTTQAFMFDRKYRINLAEKSNWATGREKLSTNDEIWYTDGFRGVEGNRAGFHYRKGGTSHWDDTRQYCNPN